MTSNIECLPFDLVHAIAVLLDIRSYVHLARANKHFYTLLRNENAGRQCLERNAPYNRDVISILRKSGCGSARKTLSLIYEQREAIRTALPYSASTVAFGTQFLFNQGVLCYVCDDQIRILDTYKRSRTELVISGHVLKDRVTNGWGIPNLPNNLLQHTTLLRYADDILILLCEEAEGPAAWLLAWDVGNDNVQKTTGRCNRLRFRRRLLSKTKIFVRHTRDFLYFGTYSAQRDDGHHEWQIQGCSLTTGHLVSSKPLRLNEFVGSEIGLTACFEIHHGYFYALSNQTSFDTEEVDWTSCYHFVSFKLDEPSPDLKLRKMWRRQHHEGPINDAWTDLSLQMDEQTAALNIIEVRKEWLGGRSLCSRTSYTTSFTESSEDDLILDRPNFPSHDQLSRTLDEYSKPSWLEKPPVRISKYCHPEFASESDLRHEFIRAKTKYHTYNSSAHSFVDLVADEVRVLNSFRSKDRLRLRVASRIPKSPLVFNNANSRHLCIRPQLNDHDARPIPNSEDEFTDTAVSLWPTDNASGELFDLLCPGGRVGSMNAVSNDRSIVYMAGTPHAQHSNQRAIIMISFDPGWGHKALKRLHASMPLQLSQDMQLDIRGHHSSATPSTGTPQDGRPESNTRHAALEESPKRMFGGDMEAESSASASKRQRVEVSAITSGTGEPQRLLWTEPAMLLNINQGFWLR